MALAIAFVLCGALAQAQQTGRIFRIGLLDPSDAASSTVRLKAFWDEVRRLGWIEGKNITVEYRFAEEKGRDRLRELATGLVGLKVDVIVATQTSAALVAKRATTAIPIVMLSADPVGAGLVASLSHPGGNVTGVSSLGVELNTERLEVLRDAIPKLSRVGVLGVQTDAVGEDLQIRELRPAAVALKLKLEEIRVKRGPKV